MTYITSKTKRSADRDKAGKTPTTIIFVETVEYVEFGKTKTGIRVRAGDIAIGHFALDRRYDACMFALGYLKALAVLRVPGHAWVNDHGEVFTS